MPLTSANVSWEMKKYCGRKKNNIEPHQNFAGSYKKRVEVLDKLNAHNIER